MINAILNLRFIKPIKDKILKLYKPLNLGVRRILNSIAYLILFSQIVGLLACIGFILFEDRDGYYIFILYPFIIFIPQAIYWGIIYFILWVIEGFKIKQEA
jgi:hypothetical protein